MNTTPRSYRAATTALCVAGIVFGILLDHADYSAPIVLGSLIGLVLARPRWALLGTFTLAFALATAWHCDGRGIVLSCAAVALLGGLLWMAFRRRRSKE